MRQHILLPQNSLAIKPTNHIYETMIPSNIEIKTMRNDLKIDIKIRNESTTSCKTCAWKHFSKDHQNWITNEATLNNDLYHILWGRVLEDKNRGRDLIITTKSLLDEVKNRGHLTKNILEKATTIIERFFVVTFLDHPRPNHKLNFRWISWYDDIITWYRRLTNKNIIWSFIKDTNHLVIISWGRSLVCIPYWPIVDFIAIIENKVCVCVCVYIFV